MRIENLQLFQFKNYNQSNFSFQNRLICLAGPNGCGKTTILDAIYFLSYTKSYFLHQDTFCVQKGKQGFRLSGSFLRHHQPHVVECILRENGRKELKLDQVPYVRFSQHIGRFPVVIICPDDVHLIAEGAEVRRKFLDLIGSSVNPEYLMKLNQYNKILLQRNSLLKQWHERSTSERTLLAVYNSQLDPLAQYIFEQRTKISLELAQKTQFIYNELSHSADEIQLEYQSSLQEKPFMQQLEEGLERDIFSQRTQSGIHKDDWIYQLNGLPMKQAASQGQRKTFLFGLKLAHYHFLQSRLGVDPILLVDDVYEKLDQNRSNALIHYIVSLPGMAFFTDTHLNRLQQSFEPFEKEVQFIDLNPS